MSHLPISEQITFIYTTDIVTSAEFYEQKLGLSLALDQGGCRIYRVTGNAYLGVCQRPADAIQPPNPMKRGVIFTLVTPEVDRWYALLREKGVVFETEPRDSAEYGIRHAFLRDPNGYLLEIQRFHNAEWAGSES
ncbi:VOC family protein [Candidatus Eisenbacteria bacterium]|uniref:VOC family protein n=1 Tax=Eiseniibacteriota bacterium TaxID=2212470 RepID=A0ABV6YL38_UNCEI